MHNVNGILVLCTTVVYVMLFSSVFVFLQIATELNTHCSVMQSFLHAKTGHRVYFPQSNGMLFSFGRDVNINWYEINGSHVGKVSFKWELSISTDLGDHSG